MPPPASISTPQSASLAALPSSPAAPACRATPRAAAAGGGGGEPLFFLDYIGGSGVTDEAKLALVGGVAAACREAGCALLGGETADMPGLYPRGDFPRA